MSEGNKKQSVLADYYSTDEMAFEADMSIKGFTNHRLAEVKVKCGYIKLGKKIYVRKDRFNRYLLSLSVEPNQAA